jgi:hypothetical protein
MIFSLKNGKKELLNVLNRGIKNIIMYLLLLLLNGKINGCV